jgi:anti-sigma-28 factor FlgM
MPTTMPEMNGPPRRGEGTHDDMRVMDLQEQVERGEYQVDAHAVAEAIVRRLLGDRGRRTSCHGGSSA